MTVIEKTYKIKTFDEFSADEQAEIIERHRYINVDNGFLLTEWDDSYYLSIENAGFKNPKIYYDLSCCQGSGACFDSKDLDFNVLLKDFNCKHKQWILNLLNDGNYISIKIKQNHYANHYTHSRTRYISLSYGGNNICKRLENILKDKLDVIEVGGKTTVKVNNGGNLHTDGDTLTYLAADGNTYTFKRVDTNKYFYTVTNGKATTNYNVEVIDGKVTAVVGTHTHVQTADERILPRGTAFITDLGMVGIYDSVIGLDIDTVIERFITCRQTKFVVPETGRSIYSGLLMDINDKTNMATKIERIRLIESEGFQPTLCLILILPFHI